ncbi:Serine/threonine-protein kinase [Linderina pennispora]|nr:Serine/threonine-protein kinase [Linderina pennispora]
MALPGGGSGPHSIAESGVSESREVAVAENAKGISVCFQIFMVRVPLLQLYGLQFRRVSGPTWKYKDICSEILERLKL